MGADVGNLHGVRLHHLDRDDGSIFASRARGVSPAWGRNRLRRDVRVSGRVAKLASSSSAARQAQATSRFRRESR